MSTDEQAEAGCPLWVCALLELSDEPAVFVRPDGEVEAANASALELLATPDLPRFRATWPTLDLPSGPASPQLRHTLRAELKVGGQPRRLRLDLYPVCDATHPGHYVALRDEERPALHLLLANRAPITRRLLRSLCHDLRTPLNSLVLQLELLRGRVAVRPGSAADEHLEIMGSQLTSLARSIDAIYDLTAAGPSDAETRFDLRTLLRDALAFGEVLGADTGVAVGARLPEAPVPVAGRRIELLQVLMTLIASAIEGLPEGGRVTLSLGAMPPLATLVLVATGPGAHEAPARPRRPSQPRVPGGALEAARFLVEAHHGALAFIASDGEACVTIRLPLVPGDAGA